MKEAKAEADAAISNYRNEMEQLYQQQLSKVPTCVALRYVCHSNSFLLLCFVLFYDSKMEITRQSARHLMEAPPTISQR